MQYQSLIFDSQTAWTVSAGSVGGISAFISKHQSILTSSITFNGTIDILYYTAISATVAYCGKLLLDKLKKKLFPKSNKHE